MYKYLLCWRYLKTRYIALASVISVMLGVATMIVVNSVMAGFAEKMRDRLHGVLADVVVESVSLDGFYNSDEVMARVNESPGTRSWRWRRHGNARDPALSLPQRPGDHPARSDHRHPARGSRQDRRFRRIPVRRHSDRRSTIVQGHRRAQVELARGARCSRS